MSSQASTPWSGEPHLLRQECSERDSACLLAFGPTLPLPVCER